MAPNRDALRARDLARVRRVGLLLAGLLALSLPAAVSAQTVGPEALLRQRAQGVLTRRLVQVALDDTSPTAPLLYHEEPIVRDAVIVGSVRSGAWGHRVGRSLGMGYVGCETGVTPEWLASGRWEIEVAATRYPAQVQLQPWYDPKNQRIRS